MQRCFKDTTTAQVTGGLFGVIIYALFSAAFGSFTCDSCGQMNRHAFPEADRRKMLLGSLGLVAASVVVLVGGIALFVVMIDW